MAAFVLISNTISNLQNLGCHGFYLVLPSGYQELALEGKQNLAVCA